MSSLQLGRTIAVSTRQCTSALHPARRPVEASMAARVHDHLHHRSTHHQQSLVSTLRFTSPCRCMPSIGASEWRVKRMESDEELLRFMQLVLQGYFESSFGGMFQDDHSGYVSSFMRQKLEQEVEELRGRFTPSGDKEAESLCLIASAEASDEVIAGCEVCVCERLSGICPIGVPVADKDGFYIQNLIVQPKLRRQGIGNLLMANLLELLKEMNASAIYAHVEAQNEAAVAFYQKLNFQVIREEQNSNPEANLGRLLLLKLDLVNL